MTPPRALWVPFELGRPFGSPGDIEFQQRVLVSALRLLERPSGPILEDYPEDAQPATAEAASWVCPINFNQSAAELTGSAAISEELKAEIARFCPWYDRAVDKLGRTSVGVSRLSMEDNANAIASMFNDDLPLCPIEDMSLSKALKLITEDLKAYYLEAMQAQPGGQPGPQLENWFWDETAAGRILLALKERCLSTSDPELQFFGELLLVPARQVERRPVAN